MYGFILCFQLHINITVSCLKNATNFLDIHHKIHNNHNCYVFTLKSKRLTKNGSKYFLLKIPYIACIFQIKGNIFLKSKY